MKLFGIHSQIKDCIEVIDSHSVQLPTSFIDSLIAAEDHRYSIHKGVDPIGITRSIYVFARYRKIQGASTIEQQFVRTVLGKYQRTLSRKIREQIIAICVARHKTKVQIANSYLLVAYYGSAIRGIDGLRSVLGSELTNAHINDVRQVIARIKYPEPLRPTEAWKYRIRERMNYIRTREVSV